MPESKVAGNAIPGPMNRKMAAKLNRRRADYSAMIAKPRADGWVGFKRPGSNSK